MSDYQDSYPAVAKTDALLAAKDARIADLEYMVMSRAYWKMRGRAEHAEAVLDRLLSDFAWARERHQANTLVDSPCGTS